MLKRAFGLSAIAFIVTLGALMLGGIIVFWQEVVIVLRAMMPVEGEGTVHDDYIVSINISPWHLALGAATVWLLFFGIALIWLRSRRFEQ